MTVDPATWESYERLIAVEPLLHRIAPLAELATDLPKRTLFHAGPPFRLDEALPSPVRNSLWSAAMAEGWVETMEEASAAFESVAFHIAPAQDHGLVTPLAFVTGPSTYCLEVIDAKNPNARMLAPLNDGPPPHALRFGTGRAEGLALLEALNTRAGPDFAKHMKPDVPILPLMAESLQNGDDLHGHLAHAQTLMPGLFTEGLAPEASDYLAAANQFALNIVMAACALMLQAGEGVDGSQLLTKAAGNGSTFGYQVAEAPGAWITQPATPPVGKLFKEGAPLPAIGDSAVIDALGLGAPCLRFSGELLAFFEGSLEDVPSHEAFIGAHPALSLPGLKLGRDGIKGDEPLQVVLGILDEGGQLGLVGRGLSKVSLMAHHA